MPPRADLAPIVAPAEAGAQGQATEIPGFPLSRERRAKGAKGAKVGYVELDYSLEGRDPLLPWAPAFAGEAICFISGWIV